jgi:hypothetical protein
MALGCVWVGCGDDDSDLFAGQDGGQYDGSEPGVCKLSECPSPPMGVACCTPTAQCGMDPLGLGLNCAPLPGEPLSDNVCVLADCPTPVVGTPCCTPFGSCGNDPYATGQVCFANPPPVNLPPLPTPDASVEPICPLDDCPVPEVGAACCLPTGECGVDPFGIGFCFPPPPEVDEDASVPEFPTFPEPEPLPPPMTEPPDDPSITGECPSFLGFFGPIWGCCSDFGVCGTFASGECLLPAGTQIPASGEELPETVLTCTAP